MIGLPLTIRAETPPSIPATDSITTDTPDDPPARPVILHRSTDNTLPDISDIFGGYEADDPEAVQLLSEQTPPVSNTTPIDEDNLVIVEVRSRRVILSDAMPGYMSGDALLLPLKNLSEILQLPIRVDSSANTAEGWLAGDQSFHLDANTKRVEIDGTTETPGAGQIEVKEGDIYIATDLLGEWLSLHFQFSFADMQLLIAGKDGNLLPAEREMEKEKNRQALRQQKTDALAAYPEMRAPYALYRLPFADIDYNLRYDQRDNRRVRNETSILANGELFYMQSNLYAFVTQADSLRDLRFSLSRKDPRGRLFDEDEAISDTILGQTFHDLNIRELTLGDIYSPQLPLTALSQNGRGVTISSQPLNRASQYDRTNISGNLQPNWEVELYRNDELLSFQRTGSDGRYEFVDVPLLSGENVIRLVYYGPFGEVREDSRSFTVAPQITRKGASYFRFSATQQGQNLLPTISSQSLSPSSFFPTFDADALEETKGEMRATFEYEYGLLDELALYGTAATLPNVTGDPRHYLSLGAGGVLANIYTRLDAARDNQGGSAVQLSSQTNALGVNLSGRHQQFFNGFISDLTEAASDPVTLRSTLRADTTLPVPLLSSLSVGLSAGRTEYRSGQERDEIQQRLTTSIGRVALNNNLLLTRTTPASGAKTENTRGDLLISTPVFGIAIRGNINYAVTPEAEIQSLSLTTDLPLNETLLLRGDIFKQTIGERNTSYTAAVNKRFEQFSLGGNLSYENTGNIAAGVSLSVGIGQDEHNSDIYLYPDATAQSGLISARSFVDSNRNGLYDATEEMIAATGYRINDASYPRLANKEESNARHMLRHIPANEYVTITIDSESLDDPFLLAGESGKRVLTHPGVPMAVDFPLVRGADIEGTVSLKDTKGKEEGAANVLVEAVDANGLVVRSARSAYDGYYVLELIPAGDYTLRISPEQLDRLHLRGDREEIITIIGDEEIIEGVDFILYPGRE